MRLQTPLSDHLHLGCGLTTPPNWVNMDGSWQVVLARHAWLKRLLVALAVLPRKQAAIPWSREVLRWNVLRGLPFPADSFGVVYSSHMLEHLHYEDATALLRECHRVLKRRGVCRFVVPDLETIVRRYLERKAAGQHAVADLMMKELMMHDDERERGILGLYHRLTAFHHHKWMYDGASLKWMFQSVGFGNVREAAFLDSRIERIREVEHGSRILDGQGAAVEGEKP